MGISHFPESGSDGSLLNGQGLHETLVAIQIQLIRFSTLEPWIRRGPDTQYRPSTLALTRVDSCCQGHNSLRFSFRSTESRRI